MLYMVSPLYSFDLEVAIDAQNVSFSVSPFPQYLSIDQIRVITYQILLGLRYIHSAGVFPGFPFSLVHPSRHQAGKHSSHVLRRRRGTQKHNSIDWQLCDFGLARSNAIQLTSYVVTRDYRPPELLVENEVEGVIGF